MGSQEERNQSEDRFPLKSSGSGIQTPQWEPQCSAVSVFWPLPIVYFPRNPPGIPHRLGTSFFHFVFSILLCSPDPTVTQPNSPCLFTRPALGPHELSTRTHQSIPGSLNPDAKWQVILSHPGMPELSSLPDLFLVLSVRLNGLLHTWDLMLAVPQMRRGRKRIVPRSPLFIGALTLLHGLTKLILSPELALLNVNGSSETIWSNSFLHLIAPRLLKDRGVLCPRSHSESVPGFWSLKSPAGFYSFPSGRSRPTSPMRRDCEVS